MRARADADVVAELPVIQIVPCAAFGRAGKGAGFIALESGMLQGGMHGFFNILRGIVFGQAFGWRVAEGCVRLQGKLIGADVLHAERQSSLHIGQRVCGILLRQGIHQINIDALENAAGFFDGGAGFICRVNAPQRGELVVVETLHADGQAVDACAAEALEFVVVERAGIGFQRDFGFGIQFNQGTDAAEQPVDGRYGKHAGRAAADKHGFDAASPKMGQFVLQVGEQGLDVCVFVQRGFDGVRIKVAIRAFLQAPGDVDV